ncbi:hypothetical protein [Streptomyces sp. NBC_00280]|uniref:hypothetical protein n=1 Tax=Streptomyces sp. NBC_00280 TaxID=2975699 RepID=UPI00325379AD
MGALLIFVLFCLLVGTGAFFQSRHFFRSLERQYEMRGQVNPQAVFQAAAEAAKGIRWTVRETRQGLETRHPVGSVIRVNLETEENGECVTTLFLRDIAFTSQLGGLIKTPRAFRAIQRKRKRMIAAISSVPGAGDWLEVDGLN